MFSSKITKLARISQLLKSNRIPRLESSICNQKRTKTDLHEPDYLISMEPDEPVYDCLNLQLKGYDFAVLEACQKQIHRYAEVMGIQVDDRWWTSQHGRSARSCGARARCCRRAASSACTSTRPSTRRCATCPTTSCWTSSSSSRIWAAAALIRRRGSSCVCF